MFVQCNKKIHEFEKNIMFVLLQPGSLVLNYDCFIKIKSSLSSFYRLNLLPHPCLSVSFCSVFLCHDMHWNRK